MTALLHRRENSSERAGARPRRSPGAQRLRRHADFQRVYRGGRRLAGVHVTAFYRRREPAGEARVGLAVGRALGGAVVRNRIKRRLREAVRRQLDRLAAPVDVVLQAKRSLLQAEFSVLVEEVGRAFQKIGGQLPGAGGQQEEEKR